MSLSFKLKNFMNNSLKVSIIIKILIFCIKNIIKKEQLDIDIVVSELIILS